MVFLIPHEEQFPLFHLWLHNLNNQMLRYERYKANVENIPTSTDEVLLEMAVGQGGVKLININ